MALSYDEDGETIRAPKKVKKWMGSVPTNCDKCSQPLSQQFIDGATQMGQWGILCAACHHRCGCGLGLGRGQRYDLKTLEKIDG